MRILIADGDGALAPTCLVFFAYWGHEVEVALNGLAALRRAHSWEPDVVVSEVALDRMDGLSLTAAIQADARLRGTVVVLAGPAEDVHARRRARDLGVHAYLSTPLVVKDLHRLVSRLAESRGASARGLIATRRQPGYPP
jgi:two-component system, OmpR family, KDP operon response regulator KdpE